MLISPRFFVSACRFSAGLALLLGPGSLRAADITWNANSYWEYSIYWSGGVRPTAVDNVFVNNPGLGADNNLVVAPPQPVPDPGWTGTGSYGTITLNSASAQRVILTVQGSAQLIGYSGSTINNRASAVVNGGTWANLGSLDLTGTLSTLTVTNAGSVSSNAATVGNGASASSTVSIVNGGLWFNDSSMDVGTNGGNGLVNIDSGGMLDLDGSLILGSGGSASAGAVQILATGGTKGILQAYSVVKATGAGTGTLTFDGGVLRAQRNEANFVTGFGANDLGITSNGAYIDSAGYNVGISSGFVGQGGLAKQGLGTLTLTGNSSYEGNTVVQRGTLEVSGSGVINSPSASLGIGANAGENGTLLLSSGGQVTAASLFVGSSSTAIGAVNVTNGTLAVSGSMSVGSNGTGSFSLGNGSVTNGNSFFGSGSGTGNATVTGGTWTNTADLLYGRGTLAISGGTVTTAGNSILGAYAGTSSTATVSGGTLTTAGYLIVGTASTGSLTVSGGFVTASGGLIVGYDTGGIGTVTLSGGTLSTSFILRQNGGVGTLNLNDGTLRALANNSNFISGFADDKVILGGSGSLAIDTNGFAIGINNNLTSTGSLVKRGLGTLTLGGNNTYEGDVEVDAGTLLVTGNSSADYGFFVDAHATLGGTGTVNDVEVWDQGILTAGSDSSAGLLTIEGDLNMEAASILKLQIFSVGSFDQLAVEGLFTVSDAILRLEVNYTAQLGDSFLLFTDGTPADAVFSLESNLGGGLSWDTSELSSDGRVTVVPEPGTLSLAVLGLGALACGIQRRRRASC